MNRYAIKRLDTGEFLSCAKKWVPEQKSRLFCRICDIKNHLKWNKEFKDLDKSLLTIVSYDLVKSGEESM